MNTFYKIVAANLVALVCVAIAGLMAFSSLDGWGWFLFIALFTSESFSAKRIIKMEQPNSKVRDDAAPNPNTSNHEQSH